MTPDTAGGRNQPLRGTRVIEIGVFHAGPTAAAMLASLGAEILKIEAPNTANRSRGMARIHGQSNMLDNERTVTFETYNGGKKSVALDLDRPEGRALLHRLVARSDVFLNNVRRPTAERLGIDYPTLLRHNPKLVYAKVSGFGQEGPAAGRPGLDPVGLARSGLMNILADGGAPSTPPTGIADRITGILAGYGILAALLARDRTGEPQQVETSLFGSSMWLAQLNVQYALFTGRDLKTADRGDDPLFSSYLCADDRWLTICCVGNRQSWVGLCAGLGLDALVDDPSFATPEARRTNRTDLVAQLEARFATRNSADWEVALAAQPAVIFEIVRRASDIAADPQAAANGYVTEVAHAALGPVKRLAFPLRMNGAITDGATGAAPRHGEHTEEVLSELLGIAAEEQADLRKAGVIRGDDRTFGG